MSTFEEYRALGPDASLDRLTRTPDDVERAISRHADADLGRRPASESWSAKEIVCHLRDVEELLRSLSPAEWQRGGIHAGRGRLTLAEWVASLAAHDDNHLDQLRRAVEGRA